MNVGNPIWFLPLSLLRDRSQGGAVSRKDVLFAEGHGGSAPQSSEAVSKVIPIGRRGSPPSGGGTERENTGRPGPEDGPAAPDAKGKKRRRDHTDPDWLETKVRALYAEVVEEPLPPELEKLLKEIERKKD